MKKFFYFFVSILTASVGLIACGSDEPTAQDNPNDENSVSNREYSIVGHWTSDWKMSTSADNTWHFELYINNDGTLTGVVSNDVYTDDNMTVSGTWKYNPDTDKWFLATPHGFLSGDYTFDNDELVEHVYHIIYHKVQSDSGNGGNIGGGNNGEPNNHHYPCKSCDESGKCWNCFGSGTDPITKKKCNTCHGSGKCQMCNGKGYIIV